MLITLNGRTQARSEFLKSFTDQFILFMGENWFEHREFFMYIRELVKNIYDHNGCFGYIELDRMENGRYFCKIYNSTNPTPETNEYESNTPINFGIGLRWIADSTWPGISTEIDPSEPFSYKINYKPFR